MPPLPQHPWSHDQHMQSSHYQNPNDMADHFNGMCLSPAFRGTPNSHLLNTYRFPNISVKHFAEQLTRMDMELFKRLIPHQSLGATWSRRDKMDCGSVVATVSQFNAVSFRVISSILIEPKLKPQVRKKKKQKQQTNSPKWKKKLENLSVTRFSISIFLFSQIARAIKVIYLHQ